MPDNNLKHKANVARQAAVQLDAKAKELRNSDLIISKAILDQLFPSMEGNTADHLKKLYNGWEGNLLSSARNLNQAAALLREQANEYERLFSQQEAQERAEQAAVNKH